MPQALLHQDRLRLFSIPQQQLAFSFLLFFNTLNMNIAIIGAGAAGCFAAIEIKRRLPHSKVTVFEGGKKPLAKVAVTGGGRCNLTNSFMEVSSIDSVYPRGARLMKRLLKEFSNKDTCLWFEKAGVRLATQPDQCVFPLSQDAMEIVNTLISLMRKNGVELKTGHKVTNITYNEKEQENRYSLEVMSPTGTVLYPASHVIVTTGGSPKKEGLRMFDKLNLEIIPPVPALFSLCLPSQPITQLMGTVVENVTAAIAGTKMKADGPILITHWGLSGPAILKLSSYAARYLNEHDYQTTIVVNWFGGEREEYILNYLNDIIIRHPQKQVQSIYPQQLNSRLWLFILNECGLKEHMRWAEIGKKGLHRLASCLSSHTFNVNGKNRFKDEFVTCGGIALSNINPSTLESKKHKGLFFAGEVLDVDAITGGFNLQAAWTMAYIVAKSCANEC